MATSGGPSPASEAGYSIALREAASDPERVERLYQQARARGDAERFQHAVATTYQEAPDNLLYGAWFYRLAAPSEESAPRHGANWRVAVPLSIGLALIVWLLSSPGLTLTRGTPLLLVLWSPLVAAGIVAYLVLTSRAHVMRAVVALVALAGITVYVLALYETNVIPDRMTYLTLMLLHIPLLSGAAVVLALLGWPFSARDAFGFLTKSLETAGTAGVASIAGGIFVGLAAGMFAALSVKIPELFIRLLVIGGAGLIPILAVASVYDARVPAGEQDFRRGLGRILAILFRALLPLTLLVLVIYLLVIPFNFRAPFESRDVLIIYNALLFAVLALLVGVTPVSTADLPHQLHRALRWGIVAVTALVVVVSVYALAAVVYRTAADHLTMNRVAVIGWNVLNIGLLIALLAGQARAGRDRWIPALHQTFRLGVPLYIVWGLALVLALPWLV